MRVLLSYASEYDKGEGVHFARVFRRLGHDVHEVNVAATANGDAGSRRLVRGYPPEVGIEALVADVGGADLFVYVEPLGLLPSRLESSPVATACVLCDVHRELPSRQALARLFDHVFLYQRNYVSRFVEHPRGSVHWLPYACDTEVFTDRQLPREYDVAFVGQLFGPASERRRLLASLIGRGYHLNEQRYYRQEEIPEVYSRAKIVVNLPVGGDLNFRFFEALSCGSLLLSRRLRNGQEELFTEDVHYAAFESEEELLAKIDFYVTHDTEREKVAAAGYAEVRRHHTLADRLRRLLDAVAAGPRSGAPVRRMSAAGARRLHAAILGRMGRVDALLRMAAEKPRYSRARAGLLTAAAKSMLRRAVLHW